MFWIEDEILPSQIFSVEKKHEVEQKFDGFIIFLQIVSRPKKWTKSLKLLF